MTPLDDDAYPFLPTICAAAAELDRARDEEGWAQAAKRSAARLRSAFRLPDLDGDEPLDLFLTKREDAALVILGERVLWRESRIDWPRNRADEISAIFREKQGQRLRSFQDRVCADD